MDELIRKRCRRTVKTPTGRFGPRSEHPGGCSDERAQPGDGFAVPPGGLLQPDCVLRLLWRPLFRSRGSSGPQLAVRRLSGRAPYWPQASRTARNLGRSETVTDPAQSDGLSPPAAGLMTSGRLAAVPLDQDSSMLLCNQNARCQSVWGYAENPLSLRRWINPSGFQPR